MKPLGNIAINNDASVLSARRKCFTVVKELLGDPIQATRIATSISHTVRRYLLGSDGLILRFSLWDDTSPGRLELSFEGLSAQFPDMELRGFFSQVTWEEVGAALRLTMSTGLPNTKVLSEGDLHSLRTTIGAKDRDELMREATERNRELQESLEHLKRTRSARDRMESELNVGRDIQMNLLPQVFPPFPDRDEFSIYAHMKPAREVGGDFYDFFFAGPDLLCLVIGDVSGKGVASALFAAVTKTLISSFAKHDGSPASILTQANAELSINNESCMFVTLLMAIVDVGTGEVVYTNAGHNPPLVKRSTGEVAPLNERHGPIAGAMEGITYKEGRFSLAPGDLLFLFTDGVTEATNVNNELFGDERLETALASQAEAEPEALISTVIDEVGTFEGDAPQFDDITMLAFHFFGRDESAAATLDLSIVNSLGQLTVVADAVDEFCDANAISTAVAARVHIVFDEVLNNIISYAYGDEEEHSIRIHFSKTEGWLVIRIEDDGRPFNPFEGQNPDTSSSIEDRQIGGLGIHIVEKMMDESSYQRLKDKNIVVFKKHLDITKKE
jgi:sigma-B regulation protein RsbU (phosphoserine phosphatase)